MKKQAYQVFVDIWRLACAYGFEKLDDRSWQKFIESGNQLYSRYKKTSVESLFRCLFMALHDYYEKMGKGRK